MCWPTHKCRSTIHLSKGATSERHFFTKWRSCSGFANYVRNTSCVECVEQGRHIATCSRLTATFRGGSRKPSSKRLLPLGISQTLKPAEISGGKRPSPGSIHWPTRLDPPCPFLPRLAQ